MWLCRAWRSVSDDGVGSWSVLYIFQSLWLRLVLIFGWCNVSDLH